jgi:hypothetical protein
MQCQGLLDELEFVRSLVNDPVIERYVPGILERVAGCAQSGGSTEESIFDLEV